MDHILHSCSFFNDAIDSIEEARKINEQLRDQCREYQSDISDLEDKIEELEDVTNEQRDTIKYLEFTIGNLEQDNEHLNEAIRQMME